MLLTELIEELRLRLDDELLPQHWSDLELISFIDSVYSDFLTRTRYISDSNTVNICAIDLTANISTYNISPRIIRIVKARIGDQYLDCMKYRALDELVPKWEVASSGTTQALITDYGVNSVLLHPTPSASFLASKGSTLQLRVQRLHLAPFDEYSDPTLEVPNEVLRSAIIPGCMAMAYSKDDSETYNAERSMSNTSIYEQWVERIKRESITTHYRDAVNIPLAGLL